MYLVQQLAALVDISGLPQVGNNNDSPVKIILQIVFGVLGAVTVLVITVAGFRYVISRGDPASTAKAKNTILYAVIGLLVAIAGYSIVSLVVDRLG